MGDFNIALNTNECWGSGRKSDPLADRLRTEFLMKNLIDVPPKKMAPTWDNRRSGPGYIAKRLDRFIIKASLIAQWGCGACRRHPQVMISRQTTAQSFLNGGSWATSWVMLSNLTEFS